jgi:hypothetical protein
MKSVIIILATITLLISCEKTGDLLVSNVIPGGCALDDGVTAKSVQTEGTIKIDFFSNLLFGQNFVTIL